MARDAALCAEEHPVLSGRAGNVVDVELRPLEPAAQCGEGFGNQALVDFRDVEERVNWVDALKIVDDVPDRRFGAAKV